MSLRAMAGLLAVFAAATSWSAPDVGNPVRPAPVRTPVPLPVPSSRPDVLGTVGLRAGSGTGYATWYDDGPGLYGAVHGWHYGQHRYRVTVCALRCVVVTVRDYCAGCGTGIDLSPVAFVRLGYPLTRGRVRVTITATR